MSVAVAPDRVSLSCNHCGNATFTVDRADMTEAEWVAGAKARLIREATVVGWSGGRHSLIHLCPACSTLDS